MENEKIKFVGVNSFGNAMFKSLEYNNFFSNCDILFDHDITEEEVLRDLNEDDLVFFGNSFGAEPMGTRANNIEIVRATK